MEAGPLLSFSLVDGIDGDRLSCDCYGGCWGDHSRDWPGLAFGDETTSQIGWRLCHQEHTMGVVRPREEQVGHGNYVLGHDKVLRFVSAALRDAHVERLLAHGFKAPTV